MGQYRRIEALHPQMQENLKKTIYECEVAGIHVEIIETTRSDEVQAAYYAQGRNSTAYVNSLRKSAGLYTISDSENGHIITNCDGKRNKSAHQIKPDGYGYAVDLAPVSERGQIQWNAPREVWEKIGEIAEANGLDWCAGGYGATWGQGWDNPHFEYKEV